MDARLLVEIKKWTNEQANYLTDVVILERSLTIHANDTQLVSLAYLPEYSEELALGFLLSEGIIDTIDQIENISSNGEDIYFKLTIPEKRITNFLLSGEKTSGCGSALSAAVEAPVLNHKKTFSINVILKLMQHFIKQEGLFRETGGVHSSALAKEEKVFFKADDIGRHNAVDKVIGMALKSSKKPEEFFLLSSGRISSEIVKKAIRAKIPLIVSHSAPTSEAIRLGWKYGVIILGFTRNNRCSAYTFFNSVY